ncbi:hypothetical protein [Rubritalea sp.]|uniref:hypothetical protein n=1 Tax=Rubritalea sp. TaxID=2109375 RepID=UPI003242C00A
MAKHSSFIRRKTQSFSTLSIILALFKCLQKGDASFNLLADEMRLLNLKSLCRGAIYKRLNQTAVDFLQEVIRQLIASQKLLKFKQKSTQRFKRILVEDSTIIPMGAIKASNFPACGNQTGVTAGFKLDRVSMYAITLLCINHLDQLESLTKS